MKNHTFKSSVDIEDLEALVVGSRENIYSYPIRTAIQEYVNNGKDANREAGQPDHMMDIDLPSLNCPVARIRDYGTGLSPEGMEMVYRWTGKSTKKGKVLPDGTKLTGKYGVGAKIGYKICDMFMVNSYHNGKKYEYMAHKKNHAIGEFEFIGESNTNEANGLEIILPLKSNYDIEPCREAIRRMFEYWEQKPRFNHPIQFSNTIYEDETVVIKEGRGGVGVLLDGTPYEIHLHDYDVAPEVRALINDLWHNKVYFKAKIGDLNVPMNREFIEKDALSKKFFGSVASRLQESGTRLVESFKSKQYSTFGQLVQEWRNLIKIYKTTTTYESPDLGRTLELKKDGSIEIFSTNKDKFTIYRRKRRKREFEVSRVLEPNTMSYLSEFSLNKMGKMTDIILVGEVPEKVVEYLNLQPYQSFTPVKAPVADPNRAFINIRINGLNRSRTIGKIISEYGNDLKYVRFSESLDMEDEIRNYQRAYKVEFDKDITILGISDANVKLFKKAGVNLTKLEDLKVDFLSKESIRKWEIVDLVDHMGYVTRDLVSGIRNTGDKDIDFITSIIHKYNSNQKAYEKYKTLGSVVGSKDSEFRKQWHTAIENIYNRYPFLELARDGRQSFGKVKKWMFTNLAALSSLSQKEEQKESPQTTIASN